MKIGIFTDSNNLCYGTLNYFSMQLGNAFTKYGVSVHYLNYVNDSSKNFFDLLIGFNIPTLSGMKMQEEYLLDSYGCPFVHFLVDPPYHYHELLQSQMKNQYFIFLDIGHREYYQNYCAPCKGITNGYLLGPLGKTVPFEERTIDILHTGSVLDIQKEYDALTSANVPDIIRELYVYLIERGKKEPHHRTVTLIEDWLISHGLEEEKSKYWPVFIQTGTQSELYLRSWYRIEIIKTLLEAGLKVHVAGTGWEQYFPKTMDSLLLEGAVPFEQTGALTANSKILLNVMPWFKDGFHDRIPTAMINKAVCLTDSSTYIDKHFEDGQNIVLYGLDNLKELPLKCQWLFMHQEDAKRIAEAGYQKASVEYTWEKLVLKILKMF